MYYNFNPMFAFRSQIERKVTSNPQFREFYEKNKGKSPEDICKEYGLDWGTVQKMIGNNGAQR